MTALCQQAFGRAPARAGASSKELGGVPLGLRLMLWQKKPCQKETQAISDDDKDDRELHAPS
jgi:hypothetical protein